MKKPQISIIIPIYNVERYLDKCLDSAINQTFKDIEIICVNDGSTDKSAKILNKYAFNDSRIKVINQHNQGLSVARNVGMQKSTADFIMFLDSDDYYDLTICEKMYTAITQTNADIAICGTNILYDPKYSYNKSQTHYYFLQYTELTNINNEVINKTNVVAWNKIYRKSIIEKYQIEFPKGLWFEDNSFFTSYMTVAKTIYFLDENLYNHRKHNASIMSQSEKRQNSKILDYISVIENYYTFLTTNNLLKENIELFYIFTIRLYTTCLNFSNIRNQIIATNQLSNLLNNLTKQGIDLNCLPTYLEYVLNKNYKACGICYYENVKEKLYELYNSKSLNIECKIMILSKVIKYLMNK